VTGYATVGHLPLVSLFEWCLLAVPPSG